MFRMTVLVDIPNQQYIKGSFSPWPHQCFCFVLFCFCLCMLVLDRVSHMHTIVKIMLTLEPDYLPSSFISRNASSDAFSLSPRVCKLFTFPTLFESPIKVSLDCSNLNSQLLKKKKSQQKLHASKMQWNRHMQPFLFQRRE